MPQKRTREQKIHAKEQRAALYNWKGSETVAVSGVVPAVGAKKTTESAFEKEEKQLIIKDLRKTVLISIVMILALAALRFTL